MRDNSFGAEGRWPFAVVIVFGLIFKRLFENINYHL